jgi:PAS domain S-box-containing protein
MRTIVANLRSAVSALNRRGEQILHRMAAVLVVISLGFLGLISVESWYEERAAALENLTSIAEIEARALDMYFNRIELDLRGLSEALTATGTLVDLDLAYTALKRFKRLHPEFYNVTLLNSSGDVLVSANSAPRAVRASVGHEPSFQTSLAELRTGANISVGQPFLSVLSAMPMVPIRRALHDANGGITYIVGANLPHEYLRHFWLDTPIAQRAAFGLLRDDGFLLSRYPIPSSTSIDALYGQPQAGALTQFLSDNNFPMRGNVEGASSLDGLLHLNVFRRLPSFPVTLFVEFPVAEVWSAWWQRMRKTFLQMAIVLALGFAAYRYAIRQQRHWTARTAAASDALRESEARWQFALEGDSEAVWDWDLGTNKVAVSRLYRDVFGQSQPNATDDMADWTARLHPDDVIGARAKFQAIIDGEIDYYVDEHRERCADGTWKWVHIRAKVVSRSPAGRPNRVIGTISDITAHRAHEEHLRLLEASVSNTNDIVLITEAEPVDAPGPRIVFVNAAFTRRTGYTREEALGNTPRMLQGPRTDDAVLARVRAALMAWQPVREEVINYTKSGEAFWLEMQISPIANEKGWYTHWVSVSRDITERKRVEEALLASEQRFGVAIDALQEGFILRNHKSEILVCNRSAERILGLTANQMMTQNRFDPRWRAVREDGTQFGGDAHPALVTLRDGVAQTNVIMGIDKADGQRTWISINTAPIFDHSDSTTESRPSGVVATFTDITEAVVAETVRLSLEQQLREAQKIESLGTLAGGIAHDFNNILGAILGNVKLASEDAAQNAHIQLSLNEINKAAVRAKRLVEQILTFSRRQTQDLAAQPLLPLVNEAVALLRATIPAKTLLDTKIDTPQIIVRCDATQVSQVLINLCTNAWHALPNGEGQIVISLSETRIAQDSSLANTTLAPGRYALLSVTDNGCGMDEAIQARIFEPFFTTKAVGVGTGLGLAVVHGIIKAHHGHIVVNSHVGAGTRFDIYLPAVADSTTQTSAALPTQTVLEGRGQHVIYIDDDEAMVILTVRILEKRGFRASGYLSAARALDAIREHPEDVDLVVSDYNMPGQSGLDVAQNVKHIRADLPIIITSGYITDELRTAAQNTGIHDIVYKPNTVEDLVQSIVRSLRRGSVP